jgi:hypothetical protein
MAFLLHKNLVSVNCICSFFLSVEGSKMCDKTEVTKL